MRYKVIQNEKSPYDWLVIDAYGNVLSSGWLSHDDALAEVQRLEMFFGAKAESRLVAEEGARRERMSLIFQEEERRIQKTQEESTREWIEHLYDDNDPSPGF